MHYILTRLNEILYIDFRTHSANLDMDLHFTSSTSHPDLIKYYIYNLTGICGLYEEYIYTKWIYISDSVHSTQTRYFCIMVIIAYLDHIFMSSMSKN